MGKINDLLKKTHRSQRHILEVITFEEVAWLSIGLVFGWLFAKGAQIFLFVIVILLLLSYILAREHVKKYGHVNVFGEKIKK